MIDPRQFFRSTKITFVDKHHEHDDVYTFSFQSNKPLHHIAGQHGIFILPKFKGIHIFSLASAPDEDNVMIGTHVRQESKYKQTLAALQPGDTMMLLGPVLNFTLSKKPGNVVLLAQGIGITPFRSMLVHKQSAKLLTNATLIHVDSGEHTFQSLTEQSADTSFYPTSPKEFTQKVTEIVQQKGTDATYYISGSPRFVNATKQTLRVLGIPLRLMKKDGFFGY